MQITLEIPNEFSSAPSGDLSRVALEALAVEGYRSGLLSCFQVRQMLGHESRWETEEFLAAHQVWPGLTVEDVRNDSRSISRLLK